MWFFVFPILPFGDRFRYWYIFFDFIASTLRAAQERESMFLIFSSSSSMLRLVTGRIIIALFQLWDSFFKLFNPCVKLFYLVLLGFLYINSFVIFDVFNFISDAYCLACRSSKRYLMSINNSLKYFSRSVFSDHFSWVRNVCYLCHVCDTIK